ALQLICRDRALDRNLRVLNLLDALITDPGQPALERLRLRGRNGLNEPEYRLGRRHVATIEFAIGTRHWQLSDFFGQLKKSFFFNKLRLEVAPVFARSLAPGKRGDDIDDREPPLVIVEDLPDSRAFEVD